MTPDHEPARTFLGHLRVLDLSDARGMLAGRIFAQLGAEVLLVEPPEGHDARRMAPLDDAGRSFVHAAFNAGKRSVTADLTTDEGRARVAALAARADFVISSGAAADPCPGWDAAEAAEAANPHLIHLRVTPFGETGPKADWAATDLILWAAGGPLSPTGLDGALPYRIAVPQAWRHAAADAVGGALIAHFARKRDGMGQRVTVSAQRSATQCLLSTHLSVPIGHEGYSFRPNYRGTAKKTLDLSGSGSRTQRSKWEAKEGLLEIHLAIGPTSGRFTNHLFKVLAERGAVSADLAAWDWSKLHEKILAGEVAEEDLERARDQVGAFLKTLGKAEAVELAIAHKLLLAPIATTADLLASPQEAARGFFAEVADEEGFRVTLPSVVALGASESFPAPQAAAARPGRDAAAEAAWLAAPARAQGAGGGGGAPLAGLKVLDLAWVVAGPMIGRNLADAGATVVRVESAARPETARVMGPFPGGVFDLSKSALFDNCNAGKKGLGVDLTTEAGREVIRRLAGWADLVVESFTPGQMARWGLGYEVLSAGNPGLIMLSTSLMGQSGPWRGLAGFGNVGAAMAGFQGLVGPREGLPVGPFGPYTDFVAPRYGLPLVLSALEARGAHGRGWHLDLSQSEAGMQFLADVIAECSVTGRTVPQMGNRDAQMAPHGVFPAAASEAGARRWLAVAARDDADWARLAQVIGADRPDWATLAGRKADEDAVEAAVAAWTAGRTAEEGQAALQAAGVPAHLAATADDLWTDPHLEAQGHFLRLPRPGGGEAVVEACRFDLSRTPLAPRAVAPTVGAHSAEVLAQALGMTGPEVAALEAAGALR